MSYKRFFLKKIKRKRKLRNNRGCKKCPQNRNLQPVRVSGTYNAPIRDEKVESFASA
jgi:hypothetical protein